MCKIRVLGDFYYFLQLSEDLYDFFRDVAGRRGILRRRERTRKSHQIVHKPRAIGQEETHRGVQVSGWEISLFLELYHN